MEIQATKIELASITEFQKKLHYADSDKDKLYSKFHKEILKVTWYCSSLQQLKITDEGEDVLYKLNPSFHLLCYSYLKFTLPPIKVKSEYRDKFRIAWCHNVGTNIIKFASFKEDDLDYQSFDNIWLDDYFQYYLPQGAGKRRNHKIGIGSVPILEEWTYQLPVYNINVDQPWSYGEDTANAFPILFNHSQMRAEHKYSFRRKITDLLRMQKFDPITNNWISVHPGSYMKYLSLGRIVSIAKPILWGRYAYINEIELNTYKCGKGKTEFYVKDIIISDSENPNKFNTSATVALESKYPCLAMFWKAENIDASEVNNYSNYTSNTDDINEGWDPISKNTLKYGETCKFKDMDSDHFNISESRKHFPSSPNEAGYHGYSFAWHSNNYIGEVGVTLKGLNTKLICKISDNDIYRMPYKPDMNVNQDIENESFDYMMKEDIEEKVKESPKFVLRTRLLVYKKISISKNETGRYDFTLL
jgi:hypothetical protein